LVFASPLFLFLFLPATIAAYFALPRRLRNAVLLAASVAFYAWGEARYVPLVLASFAFNW
jgi:alginate O-acetyltransferase complex protein AlgI